MCMYGQHWGAMALPSDWTGWPFSIKSACTRNQSDDFKWI